MSTDFKNDPEFHAGSPKSKKAGASLEFRILKALAQIVGFVVLSIALLLPFTRSAREAARRAQCVNNLKQIALALHQYEKAYSALPPAWTVDTNGIPLHSWRTLILPYLGQKALYQTINLAKPWNDPSNAKALKTRVPVFYCPSRLEQEHTTTYMAVIAPNGCFIPAKPRRLADVTDDHASTLMVIEVGEVNAVPWMTPTDAGESRVMSLGPNMKSHHPGGINACFVDGSVHFLKGSISTKVLRALMSASGNDPVSADQY